MMDIQVTDRLDDGAAAQVTTALAEVTAHDSINPLDEQTQLNINRSALSVRHLIITADEALAAYGQLTSNNEGPIAELFVPVPMRRRGYATQAITSLSAMTRDTGNPELSVWAHGNTVEAQHLSTKLGMVATRRLLMMRRPARMPISPPQLPDGYQFRLFTHGDEDVIVAINKAAFDWHPEQGRWTRADVLERTTAPWFDPAGLFILCHNGDPIGFHWTKRQPGSDTGEVYVVGLDPSEQGHGLGRPLTVCGIEHLISDPAVTAVELYVESDNAPAVSTYTNLGFTTDVEHVIYSLKS